MLIPSGKKRLSSGPPVGCLDPVFLPSASLAYLLAGLLVVDNPVWTRYGSRENDMHGLCKKPSDIPSIAQYIQFRGL